MSTSASAVLPADDAHAWRTALLITAVAVCARLILAAVLPLFPDETYYWEWSRHLAPGYFDHPPAIAVLIRAGTFFAGLMGVEPLPFVIRFFPVIAGGLAGLFTTLLARRLGGGAAALTAALAFSLMPLAASGLILATPDAPLLAASAAGLYFVNEALHVVRGSNDSLKFWSATGLALGLAFSSKYTSILLPLTITVAVVLRGSLRLRLREEGPYIACVIATIVFLPVLYWNARHGWISFLFQIQHGLGTPSGSAIKRELDLVGGQLGLVSPILFALAAHAVWRSLTRPLSDARFALAVVATGSWVFFAYSARRRAVEANWPAPSYIPGIALLASMPASQTRERWLRRGLVLAGVMVAVIYVHAVVPILPLPARRDPVARSAGWNGVAFQVKRARSALAGHTYVGADRYQEVSELAYHLPDRPQAFCMCLSGRRNQYDLWPQFRETAKAGDNLVLLLDETVEMHGTVERLTPFFSQVQRGELAPLLRGADTVQLRRIWSLAGYRGGWPDSTTPQRRLRTVPPFNRPATAERSVRHPAISDG